MDDDLQSSLAEIRGIGPATVAEIEGVLDDHTTDDTDAADPTIRDAHATAIGEAAEALEIALEYHASDRPGVARQHVEDAYRTLDALE